MGGRDWLDGGQWLRNCVLMSGLGMVCVLLKRWWWWVWPLKVLQGRTAGLD